MTVIIQRETFASILPELKPMLVRHWLELARNRDIIALDPDYEAYLRMEDIGALKVYTVREDGTLIGYASYLVMPHLHYRTHRCAASDVFWIDPSKRSPRRALWKRALGIKNPPGIGTRLFRFIEDDLRAEGVSVMATSLKASHPAAKYVLKRLGHEYYEIGFSKALMRN